ncbi:MAG: hypothetical protein CMJ18_21535 [Phycisphaeraceae bacterium]|nr:hypothetical protein [Phycisphaeraceae bacterium]
MDTNVIWALLLFAIALVLFFLEVFIPSGGVIGFVAAATALAAIVFLFNFSRTAGLIAILLAMVSLPFLLGLALKLWPNTPIGRLLTLSATQKRLTSDDPGRTTEAQTDRNRLLHARGEAVTDLRPVGCCRLAGKRVECLAIGGMIEAGSQVEVVAISGRDVKVKRLT